ncbi:hypothetical protein [Streptomyces sp. H27-D2]|uniref:hypothetical protein n=1 Tax=Streptomyces sp. H27-D2 TaxID=3046304 RepID=UPI002DB8D29B|nr:hypothetical protein [Streptomyces sp. H27-D2]MEC4019276.1 hypothetical protein [Streptomyces sp. H27-D2]
MTEPRPRTNAPAGPAAAGAAPGGRRGPADPVRALMERHRELCERAVDPLEIAAGLEAHGITDRTAARFRHRDVFSLAEELYARVPRAESGPMVVREASERARVGRSALHLAPGAVCAVTVAGLVLTEDAQLVLRLAVGMVGVALAGVMLRLCLRRGPLSTAGAAAGTGARAGARAGAGGGAGAGGRALLTCWLLGYALLGDWLLAKVLDGGPDSVALAFGPAGTGEAVGLAFAVAPAAGCAHWFAVQARGRLTASRGLEEFGAAVRPLLTGTLALFLGALLALLLAARLVVGDGLPAPGALVSATALGGLLYLARLVAVHGFPKAGATAMSAACAMECGAVGLVPAARLPGCEAAGRPIELLFAAYGPAAVPTLACGTAALALLGYAAGTLTRASAHHAHPRPHSMSGSRADGEPSAGPPASRG